MRNIEKYIPDAIALFKADKAKPEKDRHFFNKDGLALGTYEGYIASFGTMVKTAGLLPAVLIFSDTSGKGDHSKRPVVDAVLHLLRMKYADWAAETSLLELVKTRSRDAVLRRAVMDASVSLKLSFRTFKMDK